MKKLIALLLVLVVTLTLTACKDKENEYNTNTPYGSLTETTYASVGGVSITEKQLYDNLRASGYTYLTNMFVEKLLPTSNLSTETYYEDLLELIYLDCYGTDELEDLTKSNKAKYEEKYVDTMYLKGVKVEAGNIENTTNSDLLAYYLPQVAKEQYALSLLNDENSIYYYGNEYQKENGEDVLDEDGNQVKNPYYISEEQIETKAEANFNEEATYTVVIVGFPTLADAQNALKGVNLTTGAELKTVYQNVYHFKNANFELTSEDLSVYNSALVTLISNMKSGTYKLYQEFDKTIYHIYLESEKPEFDYETISTEAKDKALEDVKESLLTSSFVSSVVDELLLDADVTIYDPVYDTLFANDNEDHTRLLASEWKDEYNNYVAKIGETYITVAELYAELESELGYSTAADYLTTKLLLQSSYVSELTEDDLKKINEDYETVMESFENDEYASYGYPATMDEDIFKLLYFGNTNEDEIINGYKAQKLWEYKIADKPESFYEALVAFGKEYTEKYFDMSIKHALFFVDYNSDGTPDDPELFKNKLSAEEQVKFDAFIENIIKTYIEEVNYVVEQDWANLTDALTFVQKQFYANADLYTKEGKSWSEYKQYSVGITVEDLSNVNVANVANFVPEFGEGVRAYYDFLVANKLIENGDLDEDYLPSVENSKSQTIKTNYGYHILGVYDANEYKDAEYTAENDDKSAQYVNIEIELNGEELTIENAYSENKYASLNQIKIYAAQVETEDGVTDLPSAVETFIGYFYSDVKAKYENSTFQNWLYANVELAGIDFANDANDAKFAEYLAIQQRQFDSYTSNENNYLANWWSAFLPKAE